MCRTKPPLIHFPANLTSETLSRTLRQLRDERLISETEAGLVIRDAPGLQQIAEGFFPRI